MRQLLAIALRDRKSEKSAHEPGFVILHCCLGVLNQTVFKTIKL
jgi:hypothetical protein